MKNVTEAYWEAYKGINIKENEQMVLESKSIAFCYYFARDVKDSNKEELFKVVLESGNKDLINIFLQYVEFDKKKFKNYLLFI